MSGFVKICGLTCEADVDAAVAAGADAVGFVLAPSRRQLTLARALELARHAHGRAMTVAVVVDPPGCPEGFDAVQIHGRPVEAPPGVRRIVTVEWAAPGDWAIADASRGRGVTGDWPSVTAPAGIPLVLAGGLTPDNVAAAIGIVRPYGVDTSSGVERSPGVKDEALLRRFVDAARSA